MIGTLDSQVIEKFKEFQNKTEKYSDLGIENVKFKESFPFNDDENLVLIGSKNIASHEELAQINDKDGLPVYDASANINTYVDENKYPNQVFEVENNDNPDISFASEGNSSAGTNFIIHKNKYFVNNHRTVIKFTNKYYSKYIYYNIFKMKDRYGFKRGYTPSQKELKRLEIRIPIPKDYNEKYKSIDVQKAIVEFLEYSFNNLEQIKKNIDKRYDIVTKMKKSLIPSTFKRTAIQNKFKEYAKENNIEFNITDINFNDNKTFGDIFTFNGGSSRYTKPYYTNLKNKGDYPLVTGSTNIVEFINPINENDVVEAPAISYNKDNDKGSIAFFHQKPFIVGGHHSWLKLKDEFLEEIDLRYSYYLLNEHFSRNMYYQSKEPRANSSVIKDINFLKPDSFKGLSSIKIQQILAGFIEHVDKEIDEKFFKKYNRFYELVDLLRETYLKRTFNKIVWS